MSEPQAPYSAPAERCRVCQSPVVHLRPQIGDLESWLPSPYVACVRYLRAEIGTLQGEVLALRLALAAKPPPLISTYEQLSIATGVPIERLLALAKFAPKPEPTRCATMAYDPQLHCLLPAGHAGRHEPPAPEPQTEAEAAIADAATWPEPCTTAAARAAHFARLDAEERRRLLHPRREEVPAQVTSQDPAQPRVVAPGEASHG